MFCIGKRLFDRSSTQTRYFNKINKFTVGNPELYLSEKQLYKVFRLYRKWTACARYRSLSLERDVLHYIAERAFWSDMEDSDFVVELMLCMHHVQTHFGYFLCPRADCYPVSVSPELQVNFAEYFLRHANRRRFTIDEKRVVNVLLNFRWGLRHPCEIAVTCCSADLLLLLLQYGALTTDHEPTMYSLICVGNILKTLTYVVRLLLELFRSRNASSSDPNRWNSVSLQDDPKYQFVVYCGRLVVRVCPQVRRSHLFNNVVRFPGFLLPEEAFRWVVGNALPELEHRIFQPLPLKHACRLRLRKVLYDSWKLPMGIESLPLPRSLRMYLNLYLD